jgi:hypothetical protein
MKEKEETLFSGKGTMRFHEQRLVRRGTPHAAPPNGSSSFRNRQRNNEDAKKQGSCTG